MSDCFSGCSSLTTVPNIPDSVTNMSYCFRSCTSLTTVPNIPDSVINMSDCFRSCTSLTTVPNIPDSVTDMSYCFSGCTSLTTVPNIPDSVTDMSYCFRSCSSLTTVPNIPDSVTNMSGCFLDCTSLTTVPNIPDSVTNMSYCFLGCTSLVTIDNFHTDILSNPAEADVNLRGAFEGCDSLKNIYIKNNFNAPDNASWSIYSVNFNETTFTVKKYGTSLDGDELKVTTLIENEPLNNDPSFALGNYTDELIFDPHKTITENDIKDMIKYHVMMSTLPNTLPPESESFMLFAKDPSKVVTNLRLSKFVDDITLQESDFDEIFS